MAYNFFVWNYFERDILRIESFENQVRAVIKCRRCYAAACFYLVRSFLKQLVFDFLLVVEFWLYQFIFFVYLNYRNVWYWIVSLIFVFRLVNQVCLIVAITKNQKHGRIIVSAFVRLCLLFNSQWIYLLPILLLKDLMKLFADRFNVAIQI